MIYARPLSLKHVRRKFYKHVKIVWLPGNTNPLFCIVESQSRVFPCLIYHRGSASGNQAGVIKLIMTPFGNSLKSNIFFVNPESFAIDLSLICVS